MGQLFEKSSPELWVKISGLSWNSEARNLENILGKFLLCLLCFKNFSSSIQSLNHYLQGPHTIWAPAADVAAGRSDYAADIGNKINIIVALI